MLREGLDADRPIFSPEHRRRETILEKLSPVREPLPVWMIADFLCRDPADVRTKIKELRASGEMERLIAMAAAEAIE